MKDAERLFEAIGEIDENFIAEAEEVPGHRGGWAVRHLAAACLALCLIVLPVSAGMANGYVSNLLAPLYGGAQTEIVDSIGVPVGASATVGDYTLTADAVIGDQHNIAVVYSLVRNDGGELPEGLRFADWGRSYGMGSGGGSLGFQLSGDRRTLYITEQWTSSGGLFRFRRIVEVTYRDLVIWDSEKETEIPVQEGLWKLKFTVRYEDTTEKIPVRNLAVTGESGEIYTVQKVLLSSVGIHMEITGPRIPDVSKMETVHKDFVVSLVFQDGTRMQVEDQNMSFHSREGKKSKGRYGAMFASPIMLEEVRALVICGAEVPVEIEK